MLPERWSLELYTFLQRTGSDKKSSSRALETSNSENNHSSEEFRALRRHYMGAAMWALSYSAHA